MSFQQKLLQDENRIRDALLDSKSSVFSENPQSPTPFGRDQWLASVLALNNTTDIEGYLNSLEVATWKEITNFSEAAKSVIDDAYTWLTTDLSDLVDSITGELGETWTNITNFVGSITTSAADWLATQGSVIQDALGDTWDDLVALIGEGVSTAVDILNDLGTEATNFLADPLAWLGTTWTNVKMFFETVGAELSSFLNNPLTWLTNKASNIWTAITDNITTFASDIWDAITENISNLGTAIGDLLGPVWDNVVSFFTTVGTELTALLNNPLSWLQGKTSAIWTAITDNITTFASDIWDAITENISNLGTAIGNLLGPAWTNVVNFFTTVGTELTALLGNPLTWLTSKASNIWTAMTNISDFATTVWNYLKDNVDIVGSLANLSSDFISTIEDLSDQATSLLSNPLTWFTDNLNAIWTAIITGTPVVYADPDSTTTGGSQGDIDIGTHDLANVDRIFFNSNDGINEDSTQPHISGLATSSLSGYLGFFAPDGMTFFIGNTNSVMTILQNSVSVVKPTTFLNKITVGSGTGTSNGDISLSGNDVIIRSGGQNVNISNIESGGGSDSEDGEGFTTLTQSQQDAGAFWLPIGVGPPTTSATQLNTYFGTAEGSIGILRPTTMTSSSYDDVYLVWKTYSSNHSAEGAWIGFPFEGVLAQSNTGVRSADLTYEQRASPVRISGNSSTPVSGNTGIVNPSTGFWGTYSENDDNDDGAFWIYENTTLLYQRMIRDFGTNAPSGDTNTELPEKIPHTNSAENATSLENVFGVDDGYIGYVQTDNRLYVKVGGYWVYREFSN